MQDVGGDDAQDAAFRQHHDHVSTRTHIVDVVRQVLELFEVEGANQRPLKLREESMLGAGRIETLEILLIVQDVDVLAVESGPEQRVDGRLRLVVVADGPDDAIGRVRMKSLRSVLTAFMAMTLVQRFVNSTAPWTS